MSQVAALRPDKRTDLQRLQEITSGCRPDMHEPDEQGLKARVVGDHLDNACGNYIAESAIVGGFQEFVIILERFTGDKIITEKFNLANLLAIARDPNAPQAKR